MSKTKGLCMMWTWLGSMNNWPLQSAPCNKNSCQIIPFCRKEKNTTGLGLARRMQPRGHNEGIYGQYHTMTRNTEKSWNVQRRHRRTYLYTYNFCNLCFAALWDSTSVYRKSRTVAPMLSSVEPFFICQADDLSAICGLVVVDGDLQTEVLGIMEERKKKGDGNKNSLSSSKNDV